MPITAGQVKVRQVSQQELGSPGAGGAAAPSRDPLPSTCGAWQELWAGTLGTGKVMGLRHFWKAQPFFNAQGNLWAGVVIYLEMR